MAQESTKDVSPVKLLSLDGQFHFELLQPLSGAIYSGADVGPVLAAAKNIIPGDFGSFTDVFYNLASETKAAAEDPNQAYDPVNVRDTWFSVATYFRRADFFLHGNPDDPRISSYWEEQTAAFDKGLAALPIPGERIRVPSDNFTIEAIWYSPSRDLCTKRPTIILGNGYDGSQEDLYHTFVVPALDRGWNALTYEGPGQPLVRRRQNLGFIPDWERAVTPLVDYILNSKSAVVDSDRVVLLGYSFGGFLAARAAAFEPRLAAVLLDGGIWDMFEAVMALLPDEMRQAFESGNKATFDAAAADIKINTRLPTALRWGLGQGLWSFNTESAYDWFMQLKEYHASGFIDKVNMPVWIADGTYESFFPGQAPKVKEALGDKATYHLFSGTAGYHCQSGAIQELGRVMFAWLHKTLW